MVIVFAPSLKGCQSWIECGGTRLGRRLPWRGVPCTGSVWVGVGGGHRKQEGQRRQECKQHHHQRHPQAAQVAARDQRKRRRQQRSQQGHSQPARANEEGNGSYQGRPALRLGSREDSAS